ncbi:MAG: M20/M25/M40 family metallo-hydrolase [Candidatus Promineifilaceae bacterium]|nr:M20/M25/M40 family metallo-hydrolase [Candidatus Promineifilaceae bacterium]
MPVVRAALDHFEAHVDEIVARTVAVQQIPAPTFFEEARAGFIRAEFDRLELKDVQQDALHNVYGRFPGRGGAERLQPIVVSAHSDTVFGAETDLTVRHNGDKVYGPGIADNSLGVAALLTLVETLHAQDLQPERDIWFVANVGEEGLGDLRGMRAVVDRLGDADAYIVLEGGLFGYICHQAIGVRRYRIRAQTPGGHSWGAFGTPSATHVLGRLIAALDSLDVPADPKTTYNVGVISGGTAINAIARNAEMQLDLRSEDPAALAEVISQVEALVAELDAQEDVHVTMEVIGDRPPGEIARDHPLVSEAVNALKAMGEEEVEFTMGSTDANVPLHRNLPAVCIGLTRSGNSHRPDEYMELGPLPRGMGQALLLLLSAADL